MENEVVEENNLPLSLTVKEVVAEKLARSGSDVYDRVVNIMAEEILDKRVKQITQHMTELDNLTKELKKLKPDVFTYDLQGKVTSQSYTKDTSEKYQKITKRIQTIEKALNKAIGQNDFSELMSLGDGK